MRWLCHLSEESFPLTYLGKKFELSYENCKIYDCKSFDYETKTIGMSSYYYVEYDDSFNNVAFMLSLETQTLTVRYFDVTTIFEDSINFKLNLNINGYDSGDTVTLNKNETGFVYSTIDKKNYNIISYNADFIKSADLITGYKITILFRSDSLYHWYTSATKFIEVKRLVMNYDIKTNIASYVSFS